MLLVYLLTAACMGPLLLVGLSLICGGGVSNLLDRVMFGGTVVDFVMLKLGGYRTGVFNLADVAISLGAVLVLVAALWRLLGGPCERTVSSR